jgi:hypothetical protein
MEEKLDETGASLDTNPMKINTISCTSLESSHTAMRLLNLQPYKTCVIQRFTNSETRTRICFCNSMMGPVDGGIVYVEVLSFSNEAWVTVHMRAHTRIIG